MDKPFSEDETPLTWGEFCKYACENHGKYEPGVRVRICNQFGEFNEVELLFAEGDDIIPDGTPFLLELWES